MSDSKVEVKACRKCGGTARYREDGLWFVECSVCGEYEGPHARKVEAKKMWNIKNTIANNGVSLSFNEKELTKIGYDAVRDYSWEVSGLDALNFPICNVCELHKVVKIVVKGILAKLQPTAPRGGGDI